MPHDNPNGWEPDPKKMGNWTSLFEPDRGGKPPGAPPPIARGEAPREQSPDDEALALDLDVAEYKPWVLQRGQARPAMMLHLRRYEAKSGLWMGWQLSYPHLIAAEYVGDGMLSLDFGTRQFVIEGTGLGKLVHYLQIGTVLRIQEFTQSHWPIVPSGPIISKISNLATGHQK